MIGSVLTLIILFIIGAAACLVGGVMIVAGVKLGTKIFGPIEIRMLEDKLKTFD